MRFLGKDWSLGMWDGQRLNNIISIDTETTLIVGHEVPRLITFQATDFDTGRVFFVKKQDLPRFFNLHTAARLVFHNAAFDLEVINLAFEELSTKFPLFEWIESGEIYDTSILYRLYMLASRGDVPYKYNLKLAASTMIEEENGGGELAKAKVAQFQAEFDKDEKLQTTFAQYFDNGITYYDEISTEHLEYAAKDVIVTHSLYRKLMTRISRFNSNSDLTQSLQVAGDFALHRMRNRGVGVDLEARDRMLRPLQIEQILQVKILATYGYVPGQSGVQDVYEWIVKDFLKLDLPYTKEDPKKPEKKLRISSKAEDLEKYEHVHFIKAFLEYQRLHTIINFLTPLETPRVHPYFVLLKNTGRTSCENPNLQNIPRVGGIRELFVPKEGHVFFDVDYCFLELCTLAQTCYSRYGFSRLRDIINSGKDPHRTFAAEIFHKDEADVTKEERQGAKACYSADTELLTQVGWVRIDKLFKYQGTPIAQYNPHSKSIEFVRPLAWTTKKDSLLEFETDYESTAVTTDHRMLMISKALGYVTEILAQDYGSREAFCSVHGGFFTQNKTVLSDLETRLAVCIQADGSYQKGQVRCGLTKDRKIRRLKWLLDSLGIEYTCSKLSNGTTTFRFAKDDRLLDKNKSFYNNLEYYDHAAFTDEVWRWDGGVYGKHGKHYYNTKEHDVDFVQTLLVLSGYKSTKQTTPATSTKQQIFRLCWYCGDRKKNIAYSRLINVRKKEMPELVNVYCPTVPTGWVVTRRNGKVAIHGNCNFGYPGGLGPKAFVSFAKVTYGLDYTIEQATELRDKWFISLPEMKKYRDDTTTYPWTLTGRVRAEADFCASKNTPFQGLAADGNKLALFNLEKAGFRPVLFIHDEIICEEPLRNHKARFEQMKQIMIDSMKMVVPDVDIKVEGHILNRWEKR